jgi:hypothetical protein
VLRVQNGGDDPLDSPPGFTGESVEFLIHQRGSLIATAMLLEEHARTAEPGLRPWYTIATTLCAHAAAERVLHEWAEQCDPGTYSTVVSEQWGFVRIAEALLPQIEGDMPVDLLALSSMKSALCHPQPDHTHTSAQTALWVAADGARRALGVVAALESEFFPDGEAAAG